jgi:hypothetical protein
MRRFLLFWVFSLAFFQSVKAQQILAERLPVLATPLVLDSTFKPKAVKISREELWNELIRPMQKKLKDISQDFKIDSAEIDELNQWQGLNLKTQESAIPYRTKELRGEVFLLGKITFPHDLTGWLWGWRQHDPTLGKGTTWWLVARKKDGSIASLTKVYRTLKEDSPGFSYRKYVFTDLKATEMRSTTIVQSRPEGQKKWKTEKTITTFAITSDGILKKDVILSK